MSTERLNDLDVLGTAPVCRRLPATTVAAILLLLIVLATVAIVGKIVA